MTHPSNKYEFLNNLRSNVIFKFLMQLVHKVRASSNY